MILRRGLIKKLGEIIHPKMFPAGMVKSKRRGIRRIPHSADNLYDFQKGVLNEELD